MTAVNKTYGKSIFRTIRSSLSRFLAILAIVALGVGFFAGLLSSPVDMRISADYYYDDTHMYDVKVVSTLGLTENDLSAVQAVEGVEAAMPAYDTDLVLVSEQEDSKHYTARMHSLPEDTSPQAEGYLNQLTLVEGRFPEAAGECVVVLRKSFDGETDWIGQKLMQNPDGEPLEGICEEFTVVGTVKSAAYLSMENESTTAGSGSLGLLAYTVPESFDMDYYTSFYLAVENTRQLDSFSQAYEDVVAAVTDAMDPLGEERSQIRYEELVGDAQAELDDARAEYESEKADAEQELADAKKELEDGQQELADSQKELEDAKAEIDSGWAELNQQKADFESQTASAQQEIDNGYAQLNDAQAQYDDGLQKLEEGRQELQDGWEEYNEGYEEAQEKFADAEEELADAESKIREIEEGQWYIFNREDNTSFSSYGSNADKIAAIATVFPLFFFLVAALVVLTTMTRMVEEERQQVGTLKALGYSTGKIAVKYLFYAALASITGSALGLAVGTRLFPYIIINAYNIMYDVPDILTPINVPYSLLASLSMILCTLAVTLWACWAEVREVPATLMLPKAPKAGKRILLERVTPIWSRMKFTSKVTARNLFRYKKRFLMTVVGISGCTALLVTGFGVRDSVSDIVGLQYGEISQYQLTLGLMDESALEGRDLQAILDDPSRITDHLAAMQTEADVIPQNNKPQDSLVVFVPQDVEALPEYFQFRHRTDGREVTFDEDAVVVTEKICERQGWKVGDTITLQDEDGNEAELTITDICENYIYHYVYISPKTYQEAFGEQMEANSVLCKLPEDLDTAAEEQLGTDLLQCRDVASAQFTDTLSESFNNSIQSINSIVVVLIISAGVLAFIVLYNLTNINVTEREKELATIKVLGFYDGEVSAYIYRETILLTVIGTALGLVLGIALHQFVIRTAEIDMVMFGREVYWLSYVWSTLLTFLFSALVNLVMHHKLKNISMVESMKAPE